MYALGKEAAALQFFELISNVNLVDTATNFSESSYFPSERGSSDKIGCEFLKEVDGIN